VTCSQTLHYGLNLHTAGTVEIIDTAETEGIVIDPSQGTAIDSILL